MRLEHCENVVAQTLDWYRSMEHSASCTKLVVKISYSHWPATPIILYFASHAATVLSNFYLGTQWVAASSRARTITVLIMLIML